MDDAEKKELLTRIVETDLARAQSWDALVAGTYAALNALPQVGNFEHSWTPGPDGYVGYVRQWSTPAGTQAVTGIHKFENTFIVSSGSAVITENGESYTVVGPTMGKTAIGTRRLIFVTEDIVWHTFHIIPEHLANDAEGTFKHIIDDTPIEAAGVATIQMPWAES